MLTVALRQARTEKEKRGLTEKQQALRAAYGRRFLQLAEKHRAHPVAWLALMVFTSNADPARDAADYDRAVKIVFEDHAHDIRIAGVLRNPDLCRAAERLPDFEARLRAIAAKHPRPEARGMACFVLAGRLGQQAARREGPDPVERAREAIRWLEKVVQQYADVLLGNFEGEGRVTLGVRASAELAALRKSVGLLGEEAPEIDGEDLDGQRMKLSACRGKVVVLSFWSSTCLPCRKLIPQERALAERFQGRPFALLGVNCDEDRDRAKELIQKERIPWRSWWDRGAAGPIATRWGVEGWPTVYVLDHRGVVRYQGAREVDDGTGQKPLEQAVEALLGELKSE
jgi:thiol-disulfide isomerase/thioredoxin